MAILKYFKLLGEDSHLSELLKYWSMSVYIFLADANRRECTDGGHTKMALKNSASYITVISW